MSKMEDVAKENILKPRENLSKWENLNQPLAPLTPDERDAILELSSISLTRPYPENVVLNVPEFDHEASLLSNQVRNL